MKTKFILTCISLMSVWCGFAFAQERDDGRQGIYFARNILIHEITNIDKEFSFLDNDEAAFKAAVRMVKSNNQNEFRVLVRMAIEIDNYRAAKLLLETEADSNALEYPSHSGFGPMLWAMAAECRPKYVALLLQQGADPTQLGMGLSNERTTPLAEAIKTRDSHYASYARAMEKVPNQLEEKFSRNINKKVINCDLAIALLNGKIEKTVAPWREIAKRVAETFAPATKSVRLMSKILSEGKAIKDVPSSRLSSDEKTEKAADDGNSVE